MTFVEKGVNLGLAQTGCKVGEVVVVVVVVVVGRGWGVAGLRRWPCQLGLGI